MVSKREINLDLLIVIVYVIMAAGFVLIPPLNESSLRTLIGLPMILFIPGYVLTALLFPHKDDLDGVERLGFSFGLSIMIIPLIGYSLNFTPWGIRLVPVMTLLSFFTLAMCILAIIRRSFLPADEKYFINVLEIGGSVIITSQGSNKKLSILLTILIVASVISVFYIIVVPDEADKFTEFYVKGAGGTLGGFPSHLEPGDDIAVTVGIVNHEYATINYTLDILLKMIQWICPVI
ncbi:MAG: DUF1616 domain-containing protein [Methanolobus sp.]